MRCNKAGTAAVLAGTLACLASGGAMAFLDTGTLLTNSASATYSAGSQGSSISYSATAKILVANPAIFLWKDGTPTQVTASAGGTVAFTICFSNGGANSAFNLTITDKLPNNSYFVPGSYTSWYTDLTGTSQAVNPAYNQVSVNGPWVLGTPASMPAGAMWLQFTVPTQGVGKSGCVMFTVSIY